MMALEKRASTKYMHSNVTHGRGGFTLPRYVITDHVINILHRFNEKHSTVTDRVYLRAVDIKSILKNWDRSYDQFKN